MVTNLCRHKQKWSYMNHRILTEWAEARTTFLRGLHKDLNPTSAPQTERNWQVRGTDVNTKANIRQNRNPTNFTSASLRWQSRGKHPEWTASHLAWQHSPNGRQQRQDVPGSKSLFWVPQCVTVRLVKCEVKSRGRKYCQATQTKKRRNAYPNYKRTGLSVHIPIRGRNCESDNTVTIWTDKQKPRAPECYKLS